MMRMHAGYRACGGTGIFPGPRTAASLSEVLFANVDGRFLPEATEILLEPGVGSLASHRHQVREVVPVCVELAEGTQLGHDIGGVDAVDQHSFYRIVADLAVVDQLGDEGDRAHLAHQR